MELEKLDGRPVTPVERRFLERVLRQVRALDNALRGAYAEELVASHLPGATATEGWSGWDLNWDGIRVEVKTSGYHQSWHAPDGRPSTIRWGTPERFAWDAATETFSTEQSRHADVYVFCLHAGRHLDDDWSFYVVPTATLNNVNRKTVGRAKVESLAGGSIEGAELAKAVAEAAAGGRE